MANIEKELERKYQKEYNDFLKTEIGIIWKQKWINNTKDECSGSLGDFIYDFYPEELI